jgi:biotin synthase
MKHLIDQLYKDSNLSKEDFLKILQCSNKEDISYLTKKANERREESYDKKVFLRGLIEFTNYCKCHCRYCGIRSENKKADRYRLTEDEILQCCHKGYVLGYRTFVLQGGEDSYYTISKLVNIVSRIKRELPDCAITLSIGELSYDNYKDLYDAGADRYLLRHETASKELYEQIHPYMSYENRRRCLKDLKKIGFQVGAGFMVGLPNQKDEDLVEDLMFLKELNPHMIGIGPFIPHDDTPLRHEAGGTVEKTVILLSIIRLLLPKVLLPATTALGSLHPTGRELGLKAGANVVMPNLSPISVREKYALYNGKICTGDEAAECRKCIQKRIESIGFNLDLSRGDYINWRRLQCL